MTVALSRFVFACLAMFVGGAAAADVVVIIPFNAKGPATAAALTVMPAMGRALGKEIIVKNVGNGNNEEGLAAVESTIGAVPDGSTMLVIDVSFALLLKERRGRDILREMQIVGVLAERPMVFVAAKGGSVRNFDQLRAAVAAGGLMSSYGNMTVSDRCAHQFVLRIGARQTQVVQYPDPIRTVASVVDGRSVAACIEANPTWENLEFVALSRPSALSRFAGVPTVKEKNFDLGFSNPLAIFLPRGAAPQLVDAASAALTTALNEPGVRRHLTEGLFYVVD